MEQQAGRMTVLVVEDFDDTRRMMRQFLESGGYSVVEASDGREAVETARRARPALVLMDLNLPVLDGFTATLRIREDEQMRHTPVVAVTAYDTPESRAAARAVGCDDYLAKPLDFDKLMTLLERILAKSRAQTDEAA
ncbi:MAG TPA: response regulator [Pyrinomonadaceae bacterium]|jgi:two-component system cell cycle response regulator DivK|nr:response regulator [Pyrinomonadaceae bacterium]